VSKRAGGRGGVAQLSNYQIFKNELVTRYGSLEVSRHCEARLSRPRQCIVLVLQLITASDAALDLTVDRLGACLRSDAVPKIQQLCSLFPIQLHQAALTF
jgi:hypothetical protein